MKLNLADTKPQRIIISNNIGSTIAYNKPCHITQVLRIEKQGESCLKIASFSSGS